MSRNKTDSVHINLLCEFLETALHNIIYARKIYPEAIFVRKRKYGVVVHQSVHPGLNEYITKSLQAVEFHAKHNQLSKFYICLSSSRIVFEKYVFNILKLTESFEKDSFFVKLEQGLRSLLLKLHTVDTFLPPVPSDTKFLIQLVTTEYSNAAYNNDPSLSEFPLINCNPKETAIRESDILPLHTVETDNFHLEMYIEKEHTAY